MKPTSAHGGKRQPQKAAKDAPLTLEALGQRVTKARLKAVEPARQERAKRILLSYLQTAAAHGVPAIDIAREMASGQAAWRLGHAVRDGILKSPPDAVRNAACAQGCAFCCILSAGDGGLITAFEARQLHGGLQGLAGQPDGRDWHPDACPALDPATRACRAYDTRPMICRSFLSTNAAACEANANGGTEKGAGLLGSHLDYLIILSLCRAALKGMTLVKTYSMAKVATGAVAGDEIEATLHAARHGTSVLEQTSRDALAAAT